MTFPRTKIPPVTAPFLTPDGKMSPNWQKWFNEILLFNTPVNVSTPIPTVASAATISVKTPIAIISGTTNIATINLPQGVVYATQITLIPAHAWATVTGGNIALATTAVVGKALIMTYESSTSLWYPSYT